MDNEEKGTFHSGLYKALRFARDRNDQGLQACERDHRDRRSDNEPDPH